MRVKIIVQWSASDLVDVLATTGGDVVNAIDAICAAGSPAVFREQQQAQLQPQQESLPRTEMTTVVVVSPAGAAAGSVIVVDPCGQGDECYVRIPDGVKPGQRFLVAVPRHAAMDVGHARVLSPRPSSLYAATVLDADEEEPHGSHSTGAAGTVLVRPLAVVAHAPAEEPPAYDASVALAAGPAPPALPTPAPAPTPSLVSPASRPVAEVAEAPRSEVAAALEAWDAPPHLLARRREPLVDLVSSGRLPRRATLGAWCRLAGAALAATGGKGLAELVRLADGVPGTAPGEGDGPGAGGVVPTGVRHNIRKDLARTRCENGVFEAFPGEFVDPVRGPLYRVLVGYAALDPTVGYAQGMNFVAAFCLAVASPSIMGDGNPIAAAGAGAAAAPVAVSPLLAPRRKQPPLPSPLLSPRQISRDGGDGSGAASGSPRPPMLGAQVAGAAGAAGAAGEAGEAAAHAASVETGGAAAAFLLFVRLMQATGLRRVFDATDDHLHALVRRLDWHLAHVAPALAAHLEAEGVPSVMFAVEWITTLFVYNLPFDTARVVLGLFFFEGGMDAIVQVGVALLVSHEAALLRCDFDAFVPTLKRALSSMTVPQLLAALKLLPLRAAALADYTLPETASTSSLARKAAAPPTPSSSSSSPASAVHVSPSLASPAGLDAVSRASELVRVVVPRTLLPHEVIQLPLPDGRTAEVSFPGGARAGKSVELRVPRWRAPSTGAAAAGGISAVTDAQWWVVTKRPRWMDASEVLRCSAPACRKRFSTLTGRVRRFHCRACGEVVCGGCSRRRAPLPQLGYRGTSKGGVRVCDRCAEAGALVPGACAWFQQQVAAARGGGGGALAGADRCFAFLCDLPPRPFAQATRAPALDLGPAGSGKLSAPPQPMPAPSPAPPPAPPSPWSSDDGKVEYDPAMVLTAALGAVLGFGRAAPMLDAQEAAARRVATGGVSLAARDFSVPATELVTLSAATEADHSPRSLSGGRVPVVNVLEEAPLAFRAVRLAFGHRLQGFASALGSRPLVSTGPGGGRSGAELFLSADKTLIVKSLTHGEAEVLLQLLPSYAEHVLAHVGTTLLPRFLCLVRVAMHGGGSRMPKAFVVMPNLFHAAIAAGPGRVALREVFDLKGSLHSRYVKPREPSAAAAAVATEGWEDSNEEPESRDPLSDFGFVSGGADAQPPPQVLKDLNFCPHHGTRRAAQRASFAAGAVGAGATGCAGTGATPVGVPPAPTPDLSAAVLAKGAAEGLKGAAEGLDQLAASLASGRSVTGLKLRARLAASFSRTPLTAAAGDGLDTRVGPDDVLDLLEATSVSSSVSSLSAASTIGTIGGLSADATAPRCRCLRLGIERRAVLLANVRNDVAWLRENGLMDYSLLVGVGTCRVAAVLAEKDAASAMRGARAVTASTGGSGGGGGGGGAGGGGGGGGDDGSGSRWEPVELYWSRELGGSCATGHRSSERVSLDYSVHHMVDAAVHSDDDDDDNDGDGEGRGSVGSTVTGRLESGEDWDRATLAAAGMGAGSPVDEEREWYTLGIIDILQEFNARKRAENFVKTKVLGKVEVSAVNPGLYAGRFVAFLEKHTE